MFGDDRAAKDPEQGGWELGLIPHGNTVPNQKGDRLMSAATHAHLADVAANDMGISRPIFATKAMVVGEKTQREGFTARLTLL